MRYTRTALLLSTLVTLGVNAARPLVEEDELPAPAPAGGSVMNDANPMALAGFRPARCASGETPPAELLALADWPLDNAGTCVVRRAAAAEVAVTEAQIRPVRALAEFTEATIRDPLSIIGSAGGSDLAPPPPSPPTPYGDLGAQATAAPDDAPHDYGDMAVSNDAGRRRNPLPAGPTPVTRPLRPTLLADAAVVDNAKLDSLRGGFELPSGLRVSFGIERAVYVNGALSSVTTVNLAQLGELTGRGLAPGGMQPGTTLAVIQNGPNNRFSAAAMNAGALATVIQNSLDNQNIRAVTTINATVNSMDMLRTGQMTQSVRDAMVHSLMR